MKKLFSVALLFAIIASVASAKTKRVRIYFVPWDVTTRSAMDAEAVRKTATVKFEISGLGFPDIFVAWLGEGKMREDPLIQVRDLRLVVDAEQDDGTTWSYYANRFFLRSERSGKVRLIGDSFRARFSYFYDETGEP